MLTKLVLENFKKHKDLVLDLSSGLNLVTGPNYVGKSTVLQAIRYAFEGASAVPGGKAVITRHGEKNHKVELAMQVNGNDYVITRTLTKATLTRNGEVIAKSASVVTGHLAELLGMSGQRFGQLRYAQQKKTDALLTLGATELHKIVGEVSRVEVVNEVITKCGTAVSECNGGLSVLPEVDVAHLQEQVGDLSSFAVTAHTELSELVDQIDRKNQVLTVQRESLKAAERDFLMASQRNEERIALKATSEGMAQDIDAAKLKVAMLAGAGIAANELRDHMEYALGVQRELFNQVAKVRALRAELATVTKQAEGSTAEVDKYIQLLEGHDGLHDTAPLRHQVEEAFKEKAAAESKIMELQASIASGMCPTCKRPYEEGLNVESIQRQISDLTTDLPTLARTYTRLNKELAACQMSNASLSKTTERLDSAKETLATQRAHCVDLLNRIAVENKDEPEEQLAEVETRISNYREEERAASAAELELNTAKSSMMTLETAFNQTLDRITELGPEEMVGDISKFAEEVTELEASIAELTSVYTPKSHEYTRLTGSLDALNKEMASGLAQSEQRRALEERLGTASSLGKYLRKNRDRFMEQVWSGIMGQASTFAAACTGGAVTAVGRDNKGKFTFTEGGEELPVAAASGAQQSLMGLGVQLAMASMLPSPLATILLDEPGSDMDQEHSLTLATLLAADHNQLLMVSHRELDGAVANNTIALER